MTERKHIENALRACADAGVPEVVDPWPGIRERALAGSRQAGRSRFVPRTRLSLVFAALTALLLLSTGALAASAVVDEMFGEIVPSARESGFGVGLEQEKTIDGVTVVLERAYADQNSVVIGYRIEELNRQHLGGRNPDTVYPAAKLTDASGERFGFLNEYGTSSSPENSVPEGSQAWVRAFETPEKLEVPDRHKFRFEVWMEAPTSETWKPVTESFVFNLELPVRLTPTIEVGETKDVGGLLLTLDRVENSPVGTQAFVCFDPPNDGRLYMPMIKTGLFDHPSADGTNPVSSKGCSKYTYPYEGTLYGQPGNYSLTVAEIEAYPRKNYNEKETERISGPWRFSFEVPER